MERTTRRTCACAAALALSLLACEAAAQETQAEPDPTAQAAEHFDRGIRFFEEGRYDAALAEFSRAHELAPAYQTLYNLARVHAALGHAVEAAARYEQYLREAGDEIRGRRRREAERALEEQRARIGRLVVRTDVEGARIALDGVDVATAPLSAPISVSAGSHTVEVRAPGHEVVRRAVAVAGQEEVVLDVELREEVVPRGTLRVSATVPEVTIAVDGEEVGITPLPSTVPVRAGEHVITATRAGYQTSTQRVVIGDGAEADVSFEMHRDPSPEPDEVGRVRIHLPSAPYQIRVDGETMMGFDLDLPIGAHDIELEVTDRQPYQGTLRIPPGSTLVIAPPLSWTLEARRQRLEAASQQRSIGVGLTIAGGVLLAGGVPVMLWNELEIANTDRAVMDLQRQYDTQGGVGCERLGDEDPTCADLRTRGAQLNDQQTQQNAIRAGTITAAAVGALLAAIGIVVWVLAPSDDDVDAAAGARAVLRVGPGGLSIDGQF